MTKAPFQPFSLELDDKLERIAEAKGVPTLTTTPAVTRHDPMDQNPREEGGQQTLAPASQDIPPAPAEPPPCEKMEARVKIPDYLMTELKIATIHRRVSLNHLFLAGLRATGFTIRDEDMIEDGRRLRGKNNPQHSNRIT